MMNMRQWLEFIRRAGEFAQNRYRITDEEAGFCAAIDKRLEPLEREIKDLKQKLHHVSTKDEAA